MDIREVIKKYGFDDVILIGRIGIMSLHPDITSHDEKTLDMLQSWVDRGSYEIFIKYSAIKV